jgi:hypothetical protein
MGKLAVFDEKFKRTWPRLFPVNELAMDFPSSRVDDGYLQVLIVAQALVTEMLRKLLAVCDSLKIAVEVDPDPISKRNAIFYIKKELSHCRTSNRFSLEDHERDATLGNGLPRFRALARITVTDRFSETAMQTGEVPSSSAQFGPLSIFCCQCAPCRSIRRASIRSEMKWVTEQASLAAAGRWAPFRSGSTVRGPGGGRGTGILSDARSGTILRLY